MLAKVSNVRPDENRTSTTELVSLSVFRLRLLHSETKPAMRHSKLVRFPKRSVDIKPIKQIDLAEERHLARQFREVRSEWSKKRHEIRIALERGWPIEPGIRTARIVKRRTLVVR